MKVGDYVRTIYGIKRIDSIVCGQDVRFDNTNGFDEDLQKYHDYDGISMNDNTWKEIVIGEPKEQIIELIKVGDYVNGYKVTCIDKHHFKLSCNPFEWWNDKDIKSIVTKEQFEAMQYKVGE